MNYYYFPMHHYKTQNNLLIATDVMPHIESVSITVLVKTGSRHEDAKDGGISHYLEHMAFKGTEKRTASQIAEEFDLIGGDFNAYTSHERTVYYAKVLKGDIDKALDILSDIVQHSTFSEIELERERKVILEELAQTNDLPDDIVFNMFQEVAFPDQPLGRPIIGTAEFIKSVSREDLKKYVSARYGFNNVIISAAGNFDSDSFIKSVEAKFDSLPGQSENAQLAFKYVGGERKMHKDLEQVHIVLGFPGVSYTDKHYYIQQVLAIIVGGGMSSRLFQEIREKKGLAYHISAFGSSYQDTGMFSIYSATNESSVRELLEATMGQLRAVAENIKEDEVIRAKAQLKSGLLMGQESSSSRAGRLASNFALFNKFIPVAELIELIENIGKEDLQQMMMQILESSKQPTLAVVGNISTDLMEANLIEQYHVRTCS